MLQVLQVYRQYFIKILFNVIDILNEFLRDFFGIQYVYSKRNFKLKHIAHYCNNIMKKRLF